MTKEKLEAPQHVEGSPAWVALAKARLKAYSTQIERLKAENLNLKQTIKHMEKRIMRSDHQSD